jgi:hypothetical protein
MLFGVWRKGRCGRAGGRAGLRAMGETFSSEFESDEGNALYLCAARVIPLDKEVTKSIAEGSLLPRTSISTGPFP